MIDLNQAGQQREPMVRAHPPMQPRGSAGALDAILQALGGQRTKENEVMVHCCSHDDPNPSLSITDQGGKLLVKCFAGCEQAAVIEALKARSLWPTSGNGSDGNAIPQAYKGKPRAGLWEYRDKNGSLLGYVARFDGGISKSGKAEKEFLPFFKRDGGKWKAGAAPVPRPLYGLHKLPGHQGLVIVCEGEKSADAAQILAPDCACLTWPGGSGAAKKADFSPLAGRNVVIWPDADEPGLKAARDVTEACRKIGAASVRTMTIPAGKSDGWDAADALAEGWDISEAEFGEGPEGEVALIHPRFNVLDRDGLMALADTPYIIKPLFPSRGVIVIHGPSTAGKSFFAIDQAAHIAEARSWFGFRVSARPVAILVLEGMGGTKRRVQAWEAYHGRHFPSVVKFLPPPADGFDLRNEKDVADLITQLRQSVGPGAVLYIDTLAQAMPGSEETSKDYGMALAMAGRIERAIEGAVVLIAHPGKDPSKGIRGSYALFCGLDANLELVPVPGEPGLATWCARKVKDGEDGIERQFKRLVVDLGQDEDGDPVTSCVIVPDERADSSRSARKAMTRKEADCFEAFRQAAMEYGEADQAGNFTGLHVEDWRAYFYATSAAPTQDAKRTAFNTAKKALIKGGWIFENVDGMLRPDGPGADIHEHNISEAIRERSGRIEPKQERSASRAEAIKRSEAKQPPLGGFATSHGPGVFSEDENNSERTAQESSNPGATSEEAKS
jgi:hypothetical protein